MKKMLKRTITLFALLTIMLGLVGCGKQKISLEDYCMVTVEGYDGYGTASIEVDHANLNTLVDMEKIADYVEELSSGPFNFGTAGYDMLDDLITFNLAENNNNLSNGDVVIINVEPSDFLKLYGETLESMEKALGISIPNKTIEVTVEGLEEAKVIDVMSLAEEHIIYDGANGGAKANVVFPEDFVYEEQGLSFVRTYYENQLNIIKDHAVLDTITFGFDNVNYLSNGDTFLLYFGDKFDSFYEIPNTEYIFNNHKTITVPDLGEYVSSKEQLTPELKAIFDAIAIEYVDTNYVDTDNVTVLDYYWGTLKPASTSGNLARDEYKLFAVISYEDWFFGTCFKLCETNYIILRPNNEYELEVTASSLYLHETDSVSDTDYDLEKISW